MNSLPTLLSLLCLFACLQTCHAAENETDPQSRLERQAHWLFEGSPLGQVVDFLGKHGNVQLKLAPDVDEAVSIKFDGQGKIKHLLTDMLKPHGLEFVEESNTILIRNVPHK